MKCVILEDQNKLDFKNVDNLSDAREFKGEWWKVLYVGICKTDRHLANTPKKNGIILGHEVVVTSLDDNDKRIYSLNNEISCGVCSNCRDGLTSHCQSLMELGVNMHGGYAEEIYAPSESLFEVPFRRPELATLVEPLACAVHGSKRIIKSICLLSEQIKKINILVIGAGVSGKLVTYALKKMRFDAEYHIYDIRCEATLWHKSLGVKVVDSLKEDFYNVVIDCSGSKDGILAAYNIVRRGGIICIYGMPPAIDRSFLDCLEIFERELTVVSSVAGCTAQTMSEAISYIDSDETFFLGMIGKRIPLERVPEEILFGEPEPGTRTIVEVGCKD